VFCKKHSVPDRTGKLLEVCKRIFADVFIVTQKNLSFSGYDGGRGDLNPKDMR
jgi:hypothetical protein